MLMCMYMKVSVRVKQGEVISKNMSKASSVGGGASKIILQMIHNYFLKYLSTSTNDIAYHICITTIPTQEIGISFTTKWRL